MISAFLALRTPGRVLFPASAARLPSHRPLRRLFSSLAPAGGSSDEEGGSDLEDTASTALSPLDTGTTSPRPLFAQLPAQMLVLPAHRRPLFPSQVAHMVLQDPLTAKEVEAGLDQTPHGVPLHVAVVHVRPPADVEDDDIEDRAQRPVEKLSELHEVGVSAIVMRLHRETPTSPPLAILRTGGRVKINVPAEELAAGRSARGLVPVSRILEPRSDPRQEPYARLLHNQLLKAFTQFVATGREVYRDLLERVVHDNIRLVDNGELADACLSMCQQPSPVLQEALETLDPSQRMVMAIFALQQEIEMGERVQRTMKEATQKHNEATEKAYLMEQYKSIRKQLGLDKGDKESLAKRFRERVRANKDNIPPHALAAIEEELSRLGSLESHSSEYGMVRNYLEWLTVLPWGKTSKDRLDPKHAEAVLDEDHYGLKDVKDRILEFIAVGALRGSVQGKIICLVGPPGVGKTSIGESIAKSLDRKFYRFSVGGLHDVSEIKGHRRTYIGSMPGKFIQALKLSGTSNPVVMIDEIDKLSRANHGDPASALLEALDPSQNGTFADHYLDVPVDLSRVLFVCTANVLDTIPRPLLDRMEVIRLSGYIQEEKLAILDRYILKKSAEEHGLAGKGFDLSPGARLSLVRDYCREAGVRNLKQQVDRIMRKCVREGKLDGHVVQEADLFGLLGKPPFSSELMFKQGETLPPGVIMGLAWTAMGGSVLFLECVTVGGKAVAQAAAAAVAGSPPPPALPSAAGGGGTLKTTGKLGEVMGESMQIAFAFARSQPEVGDFFARTHTHIHAPEGATPKDGPSAGITIVTALVGLATGRSVRPGLAMTGEISLTGLVLPVGGIKEKIIAAKRAGVNTVILPKANERDFADLEEPIRQGIEPIFASSWDDVKNKVFA